MAYVKNDTDSKPNVRTAPKVQHGQKRIALTTRKTKPDGTNEVMHKVEHSFDPIPHMRKLGKAQKMRRADGSIGKDAAASRDTHAAIAGHGTPHPRGTDLESTLEQLRRYRSDTLQGRDAYVGDSRLARPAPGFDIPRRQFEDGSGMTDDSAPGAQGIFDGYTGSGITEAVDLIGMLRNRNHQVNADPWRFVGRGGMQS